MARTKAAFAGGNRLSDYLGVSVIARVFPRDTVNAALRSLDQGSRRRRDLPADVMVCCVIVMALFRQVATREVLRCPEGGLRWISPDLPRFGCQANPRSRGPAPAWVRRRSRPFVTGAWHRWRMTGHQVRGIAGCAWWPLTARR